MSAQPRPDWPVLTSESRKKVGRSFNGIKLILLVALVIANGVVFFVGMSRMAVLTASLAESEAKLSQATLQIGKLGKQSTAQLAIVNQSRDSICFLQGTYSVTRSGRAGRPISVSGTGFVVANGLIATNRHVLEPWWEDSKSNTGNVAGRLHELAAFCPGMRQQVPLKPLAVRDGDADVALAGFDANSFTSLRPLALGQSVPAPGDSVVVIGYPMGLSAMLAKSPATVADYVDSRTDFRAASDMLKAANDLAETAMIRPFATFGHVGDVVDGKVVYDALTTYGSSGSPVFDGKGEVVAISTGFIGGFAGGNLGLSVDAIRTILSDINVH